MLRIEIVDDDKVEIRGRGHLASAELAEREQHDLLPADTTMRLRKQVLDMAAQRADHDIGKAGERLCGLLRRHSPGQDAGADQEHMLLAEQAQAVEMIFVRL